MTIKELNAVLTPDAKLTTLDTNGAVIEINRLDPLPLAAYGDFIVKCIRTSNEGIEAELFFIPMKKEG